MLNSLVTPILPGLLTVSVVRQSTLLTVSTPYTVTFSLVNTLPATGFVRLRIPLDQIVVSVYGPTCLDGSSLSALTCSLIYSDSIEMWVDIKNTFCAGSDCAPQDIIIMLTDTQNPSVLAANSVTSSWQVYTTNSAKEYIDGLGTGI